MFLQQQGIFSGGAAGTEDRLIFTWKTTGVDEDMTLPVTAGWPYICTVEWGDGAPDSTITADDDPDITHQYAVAGEYQVKITGTFSIINFATAEKPKLISLDNLGAVNYSYWALQNAFIDCVNMTSITIGDNDISSVGVLNSMFRGITNNSIAIDLSGLDVSNITQMSTMFYNSDFSSIDMTGWDTSLVTAMGLMFTDNINLDPDISHFNIASLTGAAWLMQSTAFSTTNYDALLIAWAAQAPNIQSNVSFDGGATKYSTGAATTARLVLTDTYGWTVTDGGQL